MSGRPLSWARDGLDWPNRAASRFVEAGGLTWHVQVAGQGPPLLMLHGTGASTHSWRDLLPRLAPMFTVVAPDLPGHAFTSPAPSARMSIPGMSAAVAALLRQLDIAPRITVGHSAGAAILAAMALEGRIEPAGMVSLNGALLPIGGVAGRVFSPLARVLAGSGTLANLFARWAGDGATVDRLIAQTGSRLDPEALGFYRRLAGNPTHASAALAMMANWDLERLAARLPKLPTPLVLVVGTKDGSIAPADAEKLRRLVPGATIERLRGLGHLAHEEDPDAVAAIIRSRAAAWGAAASPAEDVVPNPGK